MTDASHRPAHAPGMLAALCVERIQQISLGRGLGVVAPRRQPCGWLGALPVRGVVRYRRSLNSSHSLGVTTRIASSRGKCVLLPVFSASAPPVYATSAKG